MLELRRAQRVEETKKLLMAIFGTLAFSFGVNYFIVPIGLYNGGFVGIGQIVRTVLVQYAGMDFGDVDIAGLIYFLCNVPLFILAFHSLGRGFFIKTVICVICQTIFLTVIKSPAVPIIEDQLTACFIGGIIAGWGVGITLKNGASGGGQDILGVYFTKKMSNFSVGKMGLIINFMVYAVCAVLFDLSVVIYSVIYTVILSVMIDKTHSQNIAVEVNIYTKNKLEEISQFIVEQMARGCTYWQGKGALTESPTTTICVVGSKYEVTQLLRHVRSIDEGAFVVIKEQVEVEGNFFKKL